MKRLATIVCLLAISLLSSAAIALPDSMLTLVKAYSTTNSDTSLAIIQTMRQRQLAPTWQLDMAEADYCYATLDYTKALRLYQSVYESGKAKDDATAYLALLARLMQSHDIMYNEDELVTYIHELKEEARRQKNDIYLAMADFTVGKRKYYHRKRKEGYELCTKAVKTMKNSNYFRKDNELCSYYADLLQMYMDDGRYDDALRMSLLHEETILRIRSISATNKETLRYVYAMRATLLAKAGRQDAADQAYAEWKSQPRGNSIIDRPILDYLIINKHYQEAHDIIHDYCQKLKSQKDNYSYRMITMLTAAAQIDMALGKQAEAESHCQEIKTIADSLHSDKSQSLMLTTWNLIQAEEEAERKSHLLTLLGIILILSTGLGALALYYSRNIQRRNKELLKVQNSLNAGQEVDTEEAAVTNEDQNDEQPAIDENERLFIQLDELITRDKLFLKPTFSRDDMARLIGVDKNRIGHIMSNYSSASNASVYINSKRVEYGAKLLLEHPDYTISAIAQECGMSNTVTFNRTFKEIFGMTPSEYRSTLE